MKKFTVIIALLLSIATLRAAFDDTYSQCISVEYGTPQEAQEASAEIAKLPDGKKIAFSSRWDDTNPRHAATAETLAKCGIPATCYLVGGKFSKQMTAAVEKIFALGGALGSHTLSHPHLEDRMPNEIFREIALERAVLESSFDTNVVAFVLPYMTYQSPFDENVKTYVGQSIVNAGYRITPETTPDNNAKFGLRDALLSSYTFSINDRNPEREKLVKNIAAARKMIENGYPPHLTLGIHSWQSDEGLARLGKYVEESASYDFWYCNENDYAAYRTQFLKSRVRRLSARGNIALFELTRPTATHIGSDIPLALKISGKPKSVKLGADNISQKNGFYNIPQYEVRKTPKKIELLEFDAESPKAAKSEKFGGLEFLLAFDRKGGDISVRFGGKAADKVSNFRVRWVVAPCFDTPIDGVAYKGERELSATLKRNKFAGAFAEGDMLAMAQCDFLFDGKPSRVWLAATAKRGVPDADCPRDRAAQMGDFDASKVSPDFFAALSKPDAVLKNLPDAKWSVRANKTLRPFVADFNGYAFMKKYKKSAFGYAFCADFTAPRDADYTLFVNITPVNRLYLNGREIEPKIGAKLALKKGKNRVLAVFGNKALRTTSFMLAFKDGETPLPCATPAFEK